MRPIRLIKVFASFPVDVADEASSLDTVAGELNRSIGDIHGIRFEVVNWRRDVRPEAGHDVQAVVNAQIGEDYDAIVATFWGRAGTPTPRAESGTIEEVKAALERSRRSDGRPAVMIYMKSGGINPLKIDVHQLSVLAEFRAWLSRNGVLYKEFSDQASFEALLRLDLAKVAAESSRFNTRPGAPIRSELAVEKLDIPDEDELGILDYIDIQENAFGRLSELLEAQTASITRLADSLTRDAEAANQLTAAGAADRAAARRLLHRTSETWNQFADESARRLVDMRKFTAEAFEATAKRLSIARADGSPPDMETIEQLEELVQVMGTTARNGKDFRDTMAKMPRLTSEINRSKRRVVEVLDEWISQFEQTAAFSRDIVDGEKI